MDVKINVFVELANGYKLAGRFFESQRHHFNIKYGRSDDLNNPDYKFKWIATLRNFDWNSFDEKNQIINKI